MNKLKTRINSKYFSARLKLLLFLSFLQVVSFGFVNAQTKDDLSNKSEIKKVGRINKVLVKYCNLKLPVRSVIDLQLKTRKTKTTFVYGRIPKDEISKFEIALDKANLVVENDESRNCKDCALIGVVGFPSDRPLEVGEKWWDSDEESATAKRGTTVATTFGVNSTLLGGTVSVFFNPNNGRFHLFFRKWKGNAR